MANPNSPFLQFTGHRSLAYRLVLSTLTGRPLHISRIRNTSTNPGLAPHEISLLRLFEAVTNGCSIQISYTGTTITYHPGLISGAVDGLGAAEGTIVHTLPETCARGVTYFLFPLCLMAPFSKAHMNVRFTGPGVITGATASGDISIDSFRTAVVPLFGLFGIPPSRIELRVLQRSCAGKGGRGGGGIVEMNFAGQVRLPKTLHLHQYPGRVKRIRGVSYCIGVSASNNGRMIHAAREILNALVSDIHIAAQYDQAPLIPSDGNGGKKRTGIGFGLSLVAETSSTGVLYSADVVAPSEGGVIPEDIGKECAYQLLEQIEKGGCVSQLSLGIVMALMAMGSEDIGRVRLGREVVGTADFVTLGRDLRKFGTANFGLRDTSDDSGDIIVAVKGSGIGNVGRKVA